RGGLGRRPAVQHLGRRPHLVYADRMDQPSFEEAPPAPPGLTLPAALWQELRAAYATPPRAYHGLDHVHEVARRFDEVARHVGWQRPHEVFVAVLYHDAIYVAATGDNEARSAHLAEAAIARWLPGV